MRLRSPGQLADMVAWRSLVGLRHPFDGSDHDRRAAAAEESRTLRLAHARANSAWTEINESDLVRRGLYLVCPDTGELFQRRRNVYANGLPSGPVNDSDVSAFWVNGDGEPCFVGPPASGPRTIEHLVRRQTARRRGR